MTREEQVKFCMLCKNRKMDFQQGLLCRLTDKQADFEKSCASFIPDETHNIVKPSYVPVENEESFNWKTALSVILVIFAVIRLIYRLSK